VKGKLAGRAPSDFLNFGSERDAVKKAHSVIIVGSDCEDQ